MNDHGAGDRSATLEAKPFLRWAGGKRWLIPKLEKLIADREFGAFHEPFLGGGAVFFGLKFKERHAFLSDLNAELIEVYEQVRDNPEGVADRLKAHKNTQEYYYRLRGTRCRWPVTRAARFIFLNHTSYNGVFRVNSQTGMYNVPFGRRAKVYLPSLDDLRAASNRLQRATLSATDFSECGKRIHKGDLVFLDPPYTVAHNNNGFIKYNQQLFSWEDQIRLAELVDLIRQVGAYYILTNAAHASIKDLFQGRDQYIETSRRNSIGGSSASRGSATELLFTNLG